LIGHRNFVGCRENPISISIAISIWKPNPNVTIGLAFQLTTDLSVNLDLTRQQEHINLKVG
jgi:hypothetical protein